MSSENFPELFELIKSGLDNIEQGITIFDENLDLVFANKRIEDLLGFPPEILERGGSFAEMIKYNCDRGEYGPGDRNEQLKERIDEAKKFAPHTIERIRPNGTVLRINGSPLGGGGFATIYTDITKDRQYEIKLEKLINEQTIDIRRGEERLRLIANEVPAGIAYLDQNEIFQFANRRFANAYGYNPDNIIGKQSLEILSQDVYESSQTFFKIAKAGEIADFDHEFVTAEGAILDIRTYLRPDIGINGTVNGFFVLSINVTRHKTAAAALSQAQKMEAVGRLSSGIAHDFNNMLTVILGNLIPLNDHIDDENIKMEMINPAIRAAQRGADLTKQLLTVARRQTLEPRPVNISDIMDNLGYLVMSTLNDNISLDITVTDKNIWTFVDPSPLENTLLNLILNARDAIDIKGKIRVSLDFVPIIKSEDDIDLNAATENGLIHFSDSEQVRIIIQDNGAGIDTEIIKKIFDPFFSTKHNENGSGLGLAMAQSFVEQSNGSIDVKSELGSGTTFTISLPKIIVVEHVNNKPKPFTLTQKNKELALVVDDNEDVRQVVRRDLIALGFTVIEAENAREAYQLIEQVDTITTVISDIDMPGKKSGIDLIESIKETHHHILTVLMTGHGELNTKNIKIKGCRVLRKPFDKIALSDAINFSENAVKQNLVNA